jgi:flagellar motor switch protein FliM
MTSPGSPAAARSYIVERMIGASGAADQVTGVARGQAERALPIVLKSLNETLSSPVEIEIKGIEIGRQGDMIQIAGANGAMTIVASATSGDALILAIDAGALGVVTNALFGGEPETATGIERGLSAIELEVAALVFDKMAAAVNGNGARSLNLKFPLVPPITGDELKKKIMRDGPSVRIQYSVFTSAGAGDLVLSMPQRVLLQHRGVAKPADTAGAAGWSELFGGQVMRSAVTLEATVPLGRMTLGEIASLEEGQIIEMPVTAPSQTKLGARNKPLFVGEFGKLGQHYTIRIRHPFDAGQDLMDGILPG